MWLSVRRALPLALAFALVAGYAQYACYAHSGLALWTALVAAVTGGLLAAPGGPNKLWVDIIVVQLAGIAGGLVAEFCLALPPNLVRGARDGYTMSLALLPAAVALAFMYRRARRCDPRTMIGGVERRAFAAVVVCALFAVAAFDTHSGDSVRLAGALAIATLTFADLGAYSSLAELTRNGQLVRSERPPAVATTRLGIGDGWWVMLAPAGGPYRELPPVRNVVEGDPAAAKRALRLALLLDLAVSGVMVVAAWLATL
jgi:hypothetical protein